MQRENGEPVMVRVTAYEPQVPIVAPAGYEVEWVTRVDADEAARRRALGWSQVGCLEGWHVTFRAAPGPRAGQ